MRKASRKNDDLRQLADELAEKLRADRPRRRSARELTIGRLITSGRLRIAAASLPMIAAKYDAKPRLKRMLDREVLEEQGYTIDGDYLVGPSSWPRGAPPRFGGVLEAPSAKAGGDTAGQGSSGGGTVSRADIRRQVVVSREYAEWSEGLRDHETWVNAQECRTWVFGEYFAAKVLGNSKLVGLVRQEVAQDGDPEEIELWTDADLRGDYTAAELGEGQ